MKFLGLLIIFAAALGAQVPTGWKVLHDKTNACQVAVPADWNVPAQSGWMAMAPKDQGDVQLVSQPGRTVKPMNEMAQKALMIDKMIDNTPARVFFASQPTKSAQPLTPYTAHVPGNGGICAAMIAVRPGIAEDMVKKIVATLGPAK
jgi:hypothetical protein